MASPFEPATMSVELNLDRNFLHTQFASWRLQPLAAVSRYQLSTTGHASGVVSTAVDFLHTRASVLRNHLLQSEGRLFVFTQSEGTPGYYVYEIFSAPSSDQGLLASQVAELGLDAGEQSVGGAAEAVVDCSLAVVADVGQKQLPADGAAAAGGAAGEAGEAAALPPGATSQLLLSRGHGDVVLMRRRGSTVSYSNPVHPIRPQLPYSGVRPIVLEAAVGHANGDITAVLWAIRGKGPHHAACCEVFEVTLRPQQQAEQQQAGSEQQQPAPEQQPAGSEQQQPASEQQQPASEQQRPASEQQQETAAGCLQLSTVGVRLLLRTKLPPHLVRVLPPPAPAVSGNPPGEAVPGQGALLLGFDPNTSGLEHEDDELAPLPGVDRASATAASAGGGAMEEGDDDGDDMDPRTLEQAAARLAHMTSEERVGAQPPAQWADIYKESGPDGVGAMGAEPAIDLAAWWLGSGGGGAREGDGGEKALSPFWRLSCGAHRLLTTECAAQPLQPLQPLLLGVTDDVDCAVVRVDWQPQPAAGPADEAPAVQARHMVSIPALAYVAAGKTYKRHLLLTSSGTAADAGSEASWRPSSGGPPLAAVLVESQRFMYMYGATSTQEEYGRQQVVELGLEEGETVLGSRLVEQGAEAGGPIVVVATQRRLLSYRLRM